MRGGVVLYAAQENPQIDTATAEKGRFRMKTRKGSRIAPITITSPKSEEFGIMCRSNP